METQCGVKGCNRIDFANGLCQMHYERRVVQKVEGARPPDWGVRSTHPLYNVWAEIKRKKDKRIDPVWVDFWKFVADVVARPSPEYVFSRKDDAKPFGPDNWFWRAKVVKFVKADTKKAVLAQYARDYRRMHPDKHKRYELKRSFGITWEQYQALLKSQDDVCAICKGSETVFDPNQSKIRDLALDHDHTTGRIRGLLCQACNQGLGNFRDNIDRLLTAAEYLERYKE